MHGSLRREYHNHDTRKSEKEVSGCRACALAIKGPVHARHMRSRCSIIPRDCPRPHTEPSVVDPVAVTASSNNIQSKYNIALFLPYLHWESSSRRARMVEVMKDASRGPITEGITKKPTQKFIKVAEQVTKRAKSVSEMPAWRKTLGTYLKTLARVADEMDYEADERLLRENINTNPPLHVRRTLDQYYFPTLEDTSERDQDQVVYRGTKAGKSFHTRNTRVVMVDQLWLWILDDNTIITSFPRRWGRNKPDPSGVHKSLRDRLEHGTDEIRSIHHLALIIIDQCSRVFFDRTKPLDERPEVMDLFSEALGNITQMTSHAYESFWRHTTFHRMGLLPSEREQGRRHKYLDINPEGTLFREAQDVAEELKIMLSIFNEQHKVVKDFRGYLGQLNGDMHHNREVKAILDALQLLQTTHSIGKPGLRRGGEYQETVYEADALLDHIQARQSEIQDLENAALRTCRQLEGLLTLKQQQASIVEAKAALDTANESVSQGRAIMAFTVVTICFLPLGFFAAFFGMNNEQITGDAWLTLGQQTGYMFGLSAVVIVASTALAFGTWSRSAMLLLVRVPLAWLGEYSGLRDAWVKSPLYHSVLDKKSSSILEGIAKRREQRKRDDDARTPYRRENGRKDGAKKRDSDIEAAWQYGVGTNHNREDFNPK